VDEDESGRGLPPDGADCTRWARRPALARAALTCGHQPGML